jgi:Phospholipase C
MIPGERTRREALAAIAAFGAAAAFGVGTAGAGERHHHRDHQRSPRFGPGDRPFPRLPEGTDTLPKIEHIVVVMMENHSFDNYFATLGRGDGLELDRHGRPTAVNRDRTGRAVRSFRMPSTCLLDALDLKADRPAFLEPPVLAHAPGRSACVEGAPGRIPKGANPA